jgi:hypothetical protein
MKFHAGSFLLGAVATAGVMAARDRLRPVAVEIAALGLHFARLGRTLVERRREGLEDLWVEVEARAKDLADEALHRGIHVPQNGDARVQGGVA